MRLADFEMVQQAHEVAGHLIDGIADMGSAALTGPAMIVSDHAVL